jgi:hypothetical protein
MGDGSLDIVKLGKRGILILLSLYCKDGTGNAGQQRRDVPMLHV